MDLHRTKIVPATGETCWLRNYGFESRGTKMHGCPSWQIGLSLCMHNFTFFFFFFFGKFDLN